MSNNGAVFHLRRREGQYYFVSKKDVLSVPVLCEAAVAEQLGATPENIILSVDTDPEQGNITIKQRANAGFDQIYEQFWAWSIPTDGATRPYRLWPIQAGLIELLCRLDPRILSCTWEIKVSIDHYGTVPDDAIDADEALRRSAEWYAQAWDGEPRC